MPVLYFHGVPGSLGELALFKSDLCRTQPTFYVVDREAVARQALPESYFATLAATMRQRFAGQPLRLVGFSLGGSAALRVAAHLGDQVARIDCISSAAPLRSDADLEAMAGGALFRLARHRPNVFRIVSEAQSLAARLMPNRLARIILATATGGDQSLVESHAFMDGIAAILKSSLTDGLHAYRLEMQLYTQDWSSELGSVTQPVTMWHGSDDNWAPLEMARDMADRLPNCLDVNVFDGLSHYSTLRQALLELAG